MSWLHTNGYPNIVTSDVTVVDVGVGLEVGSDWAVVAIRQRGPSTNGTPAPLSIESWLASMTGDTKWLNIGGYWPGSYSVSWHSVLWTGDRLTRGKLAQHEAFTCLSS